MNGIQPVGTTREQLGLSLEAENTAAETNGSGSGKTQQANDVIAIGAQALQRFQNEYPDAEAVDSDTALQLLDQVQSAPGQDLEQVHQSFDPERVFRLVGLLD